MSDTVSLSFGPFPEKEALLTSAVDNWFAIRHQVNDNSQPKLDMFLMPYFKWLLTTFVNIIL